MFEERSKGAGFRAGVERSRHNSSTAKLYIGFLDVFGEALVVSFCTAKCAIAPCSSRLELKRQGYTRGRGQPKLKNGGGDNNLNVQVCSSLHDHQ